MYVLVQTIKDQDGEKQVSWSAYETEAEARTAYELAKENPSLFVATIGRVIASTEYSVAE
jgi:hypothetical protein